MEQFRADEERDVPRTELDMPVLDVGDHLIECLFAVGPANDGAAITFQELQAWCGLTGHTLNSWEASTLRSLSKAYLAEYMAASDPARPAPYSAPRQLTRTEVASKLLSAFDRLERQDRRKG